MAVNAINITTEVVDSKATAVEIAAAHSSQSRYRYSAKALLTGYPALRPYHPVYLVGLADNMTGVWVVREVTHIFNYKLPYTMRVLLGSNDRLLSITPPAVLVDIEYQEDIDFDIDETSVDDVDTFMDVSRPDSNDFWIDTPLDMTFDELDENTDPDPLSDAEIPVLDFSKIGTCRLNVWRAL